MNSVVYWRFGHYILFDAKTCQPKGLPCLKMELSSNVNMFSMRETKWYGAVVGMVKLLKFLRKLVKNTWYNFKKFHNVYKDVVRQEFLFISCQWVCKLASCFWKVIWWFVIRALTMFTHVELSLWKNLSWREKQVKL